MSDAPDRGDPNDVAGLPRVLLAALEQTRSSACITTADLGAAGPTIVYVNPAYCRMTGRDRGDVIGSSPRVMQGPLTDRSVLDRLRADLSAGRRFAGETVNYRADGTPFIINWSIDPVRDDRGDVTHYVATQDDVTERVRTARLLAAEAALDDALTAALTSSLERDQALERIANSIREGATGIATFGEVVVQIDDLETELTVNVGRSSAAGRSEAFEFAQPASMTRIVIEVSGMDPDEAVFLDTAGLTRFSNRAASVTAALAEYGRQRDTALRLQRTLLPPADLVAPGWELVTRYVPGTFGLDVGGDWYDVTVDGERMLCSVGDVSGRGVEAAALMGRLRSVARLEFERGADVVELFRLLDRLCEQDSQMATMLVVEIDRAGGPTLLWSAGHLPPILLTDEPAVAGDLAVAPPLGHLRGNAVGSTTVDLPIDGGFLLFTDGLVERRGEDLTTSMERLAEGIDPSTTLTEIVDGLIAAAADRRSADDIAVLALRPPQ